MLSSDSSGFSIEYLKQRKLASLFIGGVINYSDPLGEYDPSKLLEGVVESMDRISRVVRLSTFDVLTP